MPLGITPEVRSGPTFLLEPQRCQRAGCGRTDADAQPTLTLWTVPQRLGRFVNAELDIWICPACRPKTKLADLVDIGWWKQFYAYIRDGELGLDLDARSMRLSWRIREVWPGIATMKGVHDA